MNLNKKLTTLIVLFLTLGITTVSAAHSATIDLSPSQIDGGVSDTLTFDITNDGSDEVYRIKINAPSNYQTIDYNSVSCPDGWEVKSQETDDTQAVCLGDADPDSSDNLAEDETGQVSFSATSPTGVEENKDWTVSTTDNNFDTNTNSASILVDDVAPTTSTDETDTSWRTSGVDVKFDRTDDGSGFGTTYYCVDQTPDNDCDPDAGSEGTSVKVSSEGKNYVRYFSEDQVGNQESVQEGEVWVDTVAPDTIDEAPSGWQSSDVTVNLDPTDGVSGVKSTSYCTDTSQSNDCDPADGTTETGKSGTSTTISQEGTTYIRYQSTDTAGNEESIQEATVQVDESDPSISNVGGDISTGTGDTETITADVSDNLALDTSTVKVKLDTDNDGNFEETNEMTESGDGTFEYSYTAPNGDTNQDDYKVVAKDEATNQQTSNTYTITISDDEAPTTESDNSDSSATTGDDFTFEAEVTDNIGVENVKAHWKYADQESFQTETLSGDGDIYSSTPTAADRVDDIQYYLTASDSAANQARLPSGDEETKTITLTDNDAPTANLADPGTVDEDTSVTLDASGSEDNVGIEKYIWDFGDGNSSYETTSETVGHTYEDPGTYSVQVTVRDVGGNEDSSTTKDIDVNDVTDPEIDSVEVTDTDSIYSNFQTVNLDITSSDNDQVNSVVADFANLENQFRFTDTDGNGEQDLTAEWSSERSADGDDSSVHIYSSTQTTDYAKLVVPADFTLQSDSSLTYEARYTSDSGVQAPDETYLFMADGTMLATTNNNGVDQCTESVDNWCEWSLPTSAENGVWYEVHSDGSITGVGFSNYYDQDVVAVGFAAGSPNSDGVSVDVYLDDFDLPNNGVVSQESDLMDLYEVTASGTDPYEASYTLVNGPDYAQNVDVEVTAEDSAGNTETSTKDVTLDNERPVIESSLEDDSDSNGVVGDDDQIRIEAKVTDDESVSVIADASAFGGSSDVDLIHDSDDSANVYDATISVNEDTSTVESHSVSIEATDEASNTQSTTTGSLTLDTKRPDVSDATLTDQENDDGLLTSGDMVKVSAKVTDQNLDQDEIKTDASAFGAGTVSLDDGNDDDTYEATFEVGSESATDGTHSLTVEATDLAENTGSDTTGDIEVDIESPSSLQISTPSSTVYKQSDQTLNVDYSYTEDNPEQATIILKDDNENSASYTLDDSGYPGEGTTQEDTLDLSSPDDTTEQGLVPGNTYDLTLGVSDQAGTSTNTLTETDRVVIDETKPTVTLSEVAGGDNYINIDEASGDGQIVGSWSDENPVKELRPFADGDANYAEGGYPDRPSSGSFNYEFDISGWQSGASVELGVEAEDEAGNVRTKSETVTLDLNRPAAPESVTAENINIDRADDYSVEVSLVEGHEEGTVTARLSDGDNSVTATKDVSADDDSGSSVNVNFGDVSGELSEGGVDVDAKFTDKAGNDNSNGFTEFTTVHKDTIRPEVVEEDSEVTSKNTISVEFSESLDGSFVSPEDFRVQGFTITDASEVSEGEVELTLGSDMGTGDAPQVTVEDNDTIEDSYSNEFSGDVSFTPTDTLAPTLSKATTVDSDGDGYIEAVDFKFGEPVTATEGATFKVAGYSGETVSDDEAADQTIRVKVHEASGYDTGATPEVTVNSGAVEDTASTPNEFASDTTVTSDDGAAPVLLHSEINNADSDGSATKVDLTFTEFVDVSGSATADLTDEESGELRFNSQTGETVQAIYWEDGSKAALETGDAPEVSSFSEVEDVDHYRDAGHNFDGYDAPSVSEADLVVDADGQEGTYTTVQGAIDAASSGGDIETVLVLDGDYNEWVKVDKSVKLISKNPRGADPGRLSLERSDTVVRGFEITGDNADYNGISIEVDDGARENITIVDNYIHSINNRDVEEGKHEAYGIMAWEWSGTGDSLTDLVIKNNRIEDIGSSANDAQGFGIFVEDLRGTGNGLVVKHNTIEDINSARVDEVDHPGVAVAVLPELTDPTKSTSSSGVITDNANADVTLNEFGSNPVDISVAGDVSQFSAESNNFGDGVDVLTEGRDPESGRIGIEDLDSNTKSVIKNGPADATDNYFGTDGVNVQGDVYAFGVAPNTASNSLNADVDTFRRTLSSGTNMVSFPINQGALPVTDVTGGLADQNVDTVWTYTNGQWKELATGSNDDDYFRGGRGYLFNMDGEETLSVNVDHKYDQTMSGDSPSSPVSYNLTANTWNLIGSYEEFDQGTDTALDSLETPQENDKYSFMDGNTPGKIETGEAYWAFMSGEGGYANTE